MQIIQYCFLLIRFFTTITNTSFLFIGMGVKVKKELYHCNTLWQPLLALGVQEEDIDDLKTEDKHLCLSLTEKYLWGFSLKNERRQHETIKGQLIVPCYRIKQWKDIWSFSRCNFPHCQVVWVYSCVVLYYKIY